MRNFKENLFIAIVAAVFGAVVAVVVQGALSSSSPQPQVSVTPIGEEADVVPPESGGERNVAAGCIINFRGYLVGLLERDGFSIPGGGITDDDHKNPERTAIREAREETGFEVETIRHLKEYANGNTDFHIYECRIIPDPDSGLIRSSFFDENQPLFLEVPKHEDKILGITFVKPTQLQAEIWRYPEQKDTIETLFKQVLEDS